MTSDDPRPSPPDDPGTDAAASRDELASALVDGVLSAEEAAEARRRPDVAARAEAIESSRAALRAVPPAGSAARERALAAALAAFDAAGSEGSDGAPTGTDAPGPTVLPGTGDPGTTPTGATPTPLRAAGTRSGTGDAVSAPPDHAPAPLRAVGTGSGTTGGGSTRRRSLPRWLGAAAAVAVLVGAAGLAVLNSGGSDDQDAGDMAVSAPDEAAEESTGGAAPGADDDDQRASADAPPAGTGDGTERLPAPPDLRDLGTFGSEDDLATHVESLLADSPLAAESTPSLPADEIAPSADVFAHLDASCPSGLPPELADRAVEVRLQGRAVVDGRRVDVWVVGSGDGDRLVAVDATCAIVIDRSLA